MHGVAGKVLCVPTWRSKVSLGSARHGESWQAWQCGVLQGVLGYD